MEDMERPCAPPVLKEKAEATAELLKVVAVDQGEAEKLAVVVNSEAGGRASRGSEGHS